MKILILNGPNLNMLGTREKNVYGPLTLDEINTKIKNYAKKYNINLEFQQSNHEGVLIDILQNTQNKFAGVIFNPGAYSHTSIAIRDAIASISIPVVEVHISNIYAREEFRHKSIIAPCCLAQVSGFGWQSYIVGLEGLILKLIQVY